MSIYSATSFCVLKVRNKFEVSNLIDMPAAYKIFWELSTYLFSLFAYKVIDFSHKILYTWQVVGDGGKYI